MNLLDEIDIMQLITNTDLKKEIQNYIFLDIIHRAFVETVTQPTEQKLRTQLQILTTFSLPSSLQQIPKLDNI